MIGLSVRLVLCLLTMAALSFSAGNVLAQMTEAELAAIPAGTTPRTKQPIKFSHLVHAQTNLIPCQYCHIYARRSQVSGVPPMAICIGCHSDRPGISGALKASLQLSEVKKLLQFWREKKPIPWVKVHDVPDFVRYRHDAHINAKNEKYPNGVPCQECHGKIQDMHVVKRFFPNFGQMGWCMECHLTLKGAMERKRATPEKPGSFRLLNALRPDGSHRPNLTDCLTCHK